MILLCKSNILFQAVFNKCRLCVIRKVGIFIVKFQLAGEDELKETENFQLYKKYKRAREFLLFFSRLNS